VSAQVFSAVDVAADVFVAIAALQIAIARFIPAVPFVARNPRAVDALRVGRISANNKGLTGANIVGSFSGENLNFTRTYRDFCRTVIKHEDAISTLHAWANSDCRCTDFNLRVRVFQHTERDSSCCHLNKKIAVREFGQSYLAVLRKPNQIRPVELNLGPGILIGEDMISRHQRCV